MMLATVPSGYWAEQIVDEIWSSRVYDKLIPIKSGWTVVDIGASIGVFTVYASELVGDSGRVIAFEPEETSYNALLDNIVANEAVNVTPVKLGIWGSCGTKQIFRNNSNLGASTMFADKGDETVPVASLDRALEQLGVGHVDFVKIDTEGAATEILKGADLQKIDNFAIAAYHSPYENASELAETLKDAGFRTTILTRYGIFPFVYATRDPTVDLAVLELWKVFAVAGVAGFAYLVLR